LVPDISLFASFRGAAEGREPGIQMAALSVVLDSGSGADAPSRNHEGDVLRLAIVIAAAE
jgi:hypothetical protein